MGRSGTWLYVYFGQTEEQRRSSGEQDRVLYAAFPSNDFIYTWRTPHSIAPAAAATDSDAEKKTPGPILFSRKFSLRSNALAHQSLYLLHSLFSLHVLMPRQ